MKALLLCALLGLPFAAGAEVFPAFFDVTGVAANDVLNVRSAPDAASPIAGALQPSLTGVEVVAVSEDGKWGRLNIGEVSGWAAMAFLKPQTRPAWIALQGDLQCSGTEPFWALSVQPQEKKLSMSSPEARTHFMDITAQWPGAEWHQTVGMTVEGMGASGMAVLRGEGCSDGMSDMRFGISIDLFLQDSGGSSARALRGCCTLVP